MKNTIRLFSLLVLIGLVGFASSCSKDDPVVQSPVITYPSQGIPVQIQPNGTYDYTFTVVADGGFRSKTIDSAGGTVVEDSSTPGDGDTNFTIKGAYTAGATEGPGAVTLTVEDNHGNSTTASIGFAIIE